MAVETSALLTFIDSILEPEKVRDYCPNGLQVEGKSTIKKVVTGVTASQELINSAISVHADAVLVHHGYFWKSEDPKILGMKRNRLKALLDQDINLLAYHLPLDIHPVFGNNAQLAKIIGVDNFSSAKNCQPDGILMYGELTKSMDLESLSSSLESRLQRKPLYIEGGDKPIKSIAWCTGGGQGYIEQALELGVDAFVSGEISEQTVHTAKEMGIHYIAAGHHATERYGVKALGEHVAANFNVEVEFIDVNNPV